MFVPSRDDANRDGKLSLSDVRRESQADTARADAARLCYLSNEYFSERKTAEDTRRAMRSKRR